MYVTFQVAILSVSSRQYIHLHVTFQDAASSVSSRRYTGMLNFRLRYCRV